MKQNDLIFQILRLGAACCFIGHGAFGFLIKKDWMPFFGIVGISEPSAVRLMPLVGLMDVTLGILALARPMAAPLFYMSIWAIWTALCRPLAGMGWWEFMERAGNYGAPFALVVAAGWSYPEQGFFHRLKPSPTTERRPPLEHILRITTALLFIGHGGFGAFMQKPALLEHWNASRIPFTETTLLLQGWFEIIAGMAALVVPSAPFFLVLFMWKIGTELLYPISGAPMWEFIERAGSYASPLVLFFLIRARKKPSPDVQLGQA